MSLPSTAAIYLFRTAAIINAISIPGHIAFGLENVSPTLNTLQATQAQRVAAAASANGFDYMNAGFLALAAYNYQFSLTGGPSTVPEKTLFWALFASSLWAARRYVKAGVYSPMGTLVLAPLLSLGGWWLA